MPSAGGFGENGGRYRAKVSTEGWITVGRSIDVEPTFSLSLSLSLSHRGFFFRGFPNYSSPIYIFRIEKRKKPCIPTYAWMYPKLMSLQTRPTTDEAQCPPREQRTRAPLFQKDSIFIFIFCSPSGRRGKIRRDGTSPPRSSRAPARP